MLQINFPLLQNVYVDIAIRSIAVYVFMIVAIRIFGKKELAQLSVIDLVFILLISNSVQNAMVGPSTSLSGGITAALSLFLVNYTLKYFLFKSRNLNKWMQGEAMLLIYNGQIQLKHCQQAEITVEELEAAVREHGIKDIQHVGLAMLEVDGNISIVGDDYQSQTIAYKHKKLRRKNSGIN